MRAGGSIHHRTPAGSTTGEAGLSRIFSLHRVLVSRNIAAKYEDTLIGAAWTIVVPLIMAGVLIFLVQSLMGSSMRRFSSNIYIGVLVYGWFRSAVSQGTRSVVGNRQLARRPGVPPEVLPLVPVTNSFIDFALSMPVLAAVLYIGGSVLDFSILAVPYLLVCQYATSVGLAYLASAWHVLFRDVGHAVELMLTLGFFLTPIFYEVGQAPERYQWIFSLNPLVPLLDGYRTVLIEGAWPPIHTILTAGLTGTVLSIAGVVIFKSTIPKHIGEL